MRPIYIGCGNAEPGSASRLLAERFARKVQSLGGAASGTWANGFTFDEEGARWMRREMAESTSLAIAVVDEAEPLSLVELGLLIGMDRNVLIVTGGEGNTVSQIDASDAGDIEGVIERFFEAARRVEGNPA